VTNAFNLWAASSDFNLPDTNDCQYSAYTLLCSKVFQACDQTRTKKLKVCKSTCENYYDSCQAGELKDFRCETEKYNGDYRKGQYVCTGTGSIYPLSFLLLFFVILFVLN
jgi:hypothetical protein